MSIDYENPWLYLERPFTSDDVRDNYGFVYNITNLTNGRQYIGRKYFWSHRKPPGKKRRVKKESDWKKYYGLLNNIKTNNASKEYYLTDAIGLAQESSMKIKAIKIQNSDEVIGVNTINQLEELES